MEIKKNKNENGENEQGYGDGTLTQEELIMMDSLLYYKEFSHDAKGLQVTADKQIHTNGFAKKTAWTGKEYGFGLKYEWCNGRDGELLGNQVMLQNGEYKNNQIFVNFLIQQYRNVF